MILGGGLVRFPLKPPKEGLDAGDQGFGAEGFGDVIVGSQFQPNDGVGLLRLGGQHDDGEQCSVRSGPQAFADLQAVDLRQHQVEDDQIRLFLFHLPEAFGSGFGRYGSKALFLQIECDQLENVLLIFDDEDFFVSRAWHGWWRQPTGEGADCQGWREGLVCRGADQGPTGLVGRGQLC